MLCGGLWGLVVGGVFVWCDRLLMCMFSRWICCVRFICFRYRLVVWCSLVVLLIGVGRVRLWVMVMNFLKCSFKFMVWLM